MADTLGNEKPGFLDYMASALGPGGYGPAETRSRFKKNQLQDRLIDQFMEEQKAKEEYLAAKAGGPTGLAMQDIDALNQETRSAPRFDGKRIEAGTVGRIGIPDELYNANIVDTPQQPRTSKYVPKSDQELGGAADQKRMRPYDAAGDFVPLSDEAQLGLLAPQMNAMRKQLISNPNQYSGNEALAPMQADQLREQIASAPKRFAVAQSERLARAMPDEMIAADVARMTPKIMASGKDLVSLTGDTATRIYEGRKSGTPVTINEGDKAYRVLVDEENNEIGSRVLIGPSTEYLNDKRARAQLAAIDARLTGQKPPKIKTFYDEDGTAQQLDENDPDDQKIIKEKNLISSGASEGERKARGYLDRMEAAEKSASEILAGGYDPSNLQDAAADYIPVFGNAATSTPGQIYKQTKSDWARAKLRRESGATIQDEESDKEFSTYFPQPFDAPEAQIQKERARLQAMTSLATEAGVLGQGKLKNLKQQQVLLERMVARAKKTGKTLLQVKAELKKAAEGGQNVP